MIRKRTRQQMYSDNILLLKEEFTPSELTTAITVQLIEREIQRIGFKALSGESGSLLYFSDEENRISVEKTYGY